MEASEAIYVSIELLARLRDRVEDTLTKGLLTPKEETQTVILAASLQCVQGFLVQLLPRVHDRPDQYMDLTVAYRPTPHAPGPN
jgi:hypothetical protein